MERIRRDIQLLVKRVRYQENIMNRFYATLPSDSSGYYFPTNTIADFRTKLGTPLELEHDKWVVGLVEISYPNGYKTRLLHNTLRLDSEEITFPVKHYESMFYLVTNMPDYLNLL